MTPTAEELYNSAAFWKMRIEQQVEYIARYSGTRPDHESVRETAYYILEVCQANYLTLKDRE